MAKGLVLIADGDPASGALARAKLEAAGHDCVLVSDGVGAIAELHGAEFDVAVLELELGGRPAFDVIKAARHLSPDTEVIVVARNAELSTAVEGIRLGIFDLLDKHAALEGETLLLPVARAIERRRLRATTTLFLASQEIFACADPEKLPAVIVGIAARALEADHVTLALPDRSGRMRTMHSQSIHDSMGASASEEVGDDLAGKVARLGVPVLLPEDAGRVGCTLSRVHSSIVFPLSSGDRRVGVLTMSRLADPRPYRRADVDRASVLASQALLAVENATLVRRSLEAERLATIGRLAAGVAHEINNPLTFVLASGTDARETVDELRRAASDEGPEAIKERVSTLLLVADALDDVCDGGRRIADIARDLRTLARGNAPSQEVVDLGDIVRAAARVAGPGVREHAKLDLELARGTLLSGHAGRLTQVFVNLMVNAAQAGEGREPPVSIQVRTAIDGDRIVAAVSDDGPGIAPENLDLLFQPFFSTKSSSCGTGLGLSLTQSIVAEHGGSIAVTSEVGQGATFTLTFPRAVVAEKVAEDTSRVFGLPRVLFVSTDRTALRHCERWFGRAYDVVTCESAEEAAALLAGREEATAVVCEEVLAEALLARMPPRHAGRVAVRRGLLDLTDLRAAVAQCLTTAA
ncbi:MAG: hypothetical protein JWP97_4909 [Labilithrix sp.]|nr:hypothetical protein [Labilithrix sp.]